MKISTTLTKARDLISDPKRWCKFYFATNRRGGITGVKEADAVAWCARGALRKFERRDGPAEMFMQRFSGEFCLGSWNNDAEHLEVLMGFDLAIIAAKARGL